MFVRHKYLHFFFVLAFLFSSISPACAFISGKSWGEICGADGLIKKVEIPEEIKAYLPKDEQQSPSHIQKQMDCSFCFMAKSLKATPPDSFNITAPIYAGYLPVSTGMFVPAGDDLKPYEAQGPPYPFV